EAETEDAKDEQDEQRASAKEREALEEGRGGDSDYDEHEAVHHGEEQRQPDRFEERLRTCRSLPPEERRGQESRGEERLASQEVEIEKPEGEETRTEDAREGSLPEERSGVRSAPLRACEGSGRSSHGAHKASCRAASHPTVRAASPGLHASHIVVLASDVKVGRGKTSRPAVAPPESPW